MVAAEVSMFTFSPIANASSKYLKETVNTVQLLSIIFMIAGIPVGLLTTWILDVYGIRAALFLSGVTNVIGTVIRAIGTNFPTRTEDWITKNNNLGNVTGLDFNQLAYDEPFIESGWTDNPRLMWILAGQIISSFSAAVLLVPTKLAATWFPETQRATQGWASVRARYQLASSQLIPAGLNR